MDLGCGSNTSLGFLAVEQGLDNACFVLISLGAMGEQEGQDSERLTTARVVVPVS